MEAVEKSKYGWFWQCPAGENCIYRHALPPGFVLKKDKKKMEDRAKEITLEDLIEKERAALGPKQTKITLETFLAWKKRKIQEKKDNAKKEEDKKRNEYKAGHYNYYIFFLIKFNTFYFLIGRQIGLSGREMFSFNPELAYDNDMDDGDDIFDSSAFAKDDSDEEEKEVVYKEINLDILDNDAQEVIVYN